MSGGWAGKQHASSGRFREKSDCNIKIYWFQYKMGKCEQISFFFTEKNNLGNTDRVRINGIPLYLNQIIVNNCGNAEVFSVNTVNMFDLKSKDSRP